jgi:WD40 repeat protein
MQKALASMPPTCSGISQVSLTGEFREWKADVVGYSRGNQREELPGLVTRQRLKPPLRGDFTNARFSPDGQYAVAQDESSIFVLTRRPFAFLFRIDAPGAQPAAFTPDSKEIVFSTQELRVEDWNVAARKRVSVHELVVQDGCVQSLLSPDGNTLACLIERGQNTSESSVSLPYLDLEIFDVSSGDSIFAKKEFLSATFENAFYLIMRRILDLDKTVLEPMAFSPDSRYLVAASRSTTLAVDLTTKAPIPLPGSLKDMLKGGFAFPAADRVIAENPDNPRKSAILNFPSGHTISQISLGTQDLDVSAQGDYILLRPVSNALVGVMEVKTGKGIMALKQSRAIDIYDQQFIAQGTSGEFGLFDIQGTNYTKAQLPESPLGPLQTHAISPDLRWLAASGKTRGAVWDLSMMKQVYSTRNFSGAFFDGNSALFADFPKNEKTGRAIIRADLAASDAKPVFPLETELNTRQFGPYLVTRNPNRKDKSTYWDVTLKIGDVRDGKPLWELNFPKEVPAISFFSREDRVVLKWDLQNFSGRESAKQVFSRYNELEKRFSVLKENRGIYLLEVLEAGTGHSIGAVLVDTGRDSFKIEDSFAAGDWLLLTDSENRIFVYSVASGELQGTIFGTYPIVSSAAGLMETRNERGQLQFYTLPALTKVGQISFSSPISMNSFDASGTRLFVLTADQTSYIFDTSALKQPSQATPVAPK